ncbi:MAG: ComEC/Rec2 family competence protein [Nitrospiraceae bacterium]
MLPAVTLVFILGLALGSYFQYFPVTVLSCLIVSTGVVLACESRRTLPASRGAALLAGLFAGTLYWVLFSWGTHSLTIPDYPRKSTTWIEGPISHSVRHAPGRVTMEVSVIRTDDPAISGPFKLRMTWRDPDMELFQGMYIRARAMLRAPSGTLNPRGFDYAAYLEGQGIDAVATVSGPGAVHVVERAAPSAWFIPTLLERWRGTVRSAAASLEEPARSLFLSLTIGEQGTLPVDVREWFMTTGTVHILSISGSHLGLIALLTYGLIRSLCRRLPVTALLALSRRIAPSRLAAVATFIPVVAYTLLAGAETATIRSCLMIAVGLLAVWFGYPRYVLHALAASAGITLLANPSALYDISFQLSYGSVLVLALVLERSIDEDTPVESVRPWRGRALEWLRESLRVTCYVTVATLPLVAFYFNPVPWLGLFANLLVIPFVGALLLPICLASAV